MPRGEGKAPPAPDPVNGMWQGRSIARRFVSPDGMTVLLTELRDGQRATVLQLPAGAHRVEGEPEDEGAPVVRRVMFVE